MTLHLTEKLIQRQINHWNRMRQFLAEEAPTDPPPPGPVVTISRQAASGGRRLAEAIAARWELDLQDQSLVDRVARDTNLDRDVVAQLDEGTVGQVELWVQGILHNRLFLRDDYHVALVRAVTALAARGGMVFLGRGAHLILGRRATLRLRVVAPRERRIEDLMERSGMGRPEADKVIQATDRRRDEFVRRGFGTDPDDPLQYDLVLNSGRLDLDAMAEAVAGALLARHEFAAVSARS